jgi:hypothetical protein
VKTSFCSESSGGWRVTIEAESGVEGVELRRLFDLQPIGLPCNLDQSKGVDGVGQTRLIIFSPRPVQR